MIKYIQDALASFLCGVKSLIENLYLNFMIRDNCNCVATIIITK